MEEEEADTEDKLSQDEKVTNKKPSVKDIKKVLKETKHKKTGDTEDNVSPKKKEKEADPDVKQKESFKKKTPESKKTEET